MENEKKIAETGIRTAKLLCGCRVCYRYATEACYSGIIRFRYDSTLLIRRWLNKLQRNMTQLYVIRPGESNYIGFMRRK